MRWLGAVTAVAVVLAGAAPSDALVLCQKLGKVAAREECRRKEQPVDLSALGALGPQGPAGTPGAPGAPGVHPLRLVDSADVELGPILDFFPTAAFVELSGPALGQPVAFLVAPAGFVPDTAGAISTVYYQSTDCSGVPYIREQYGMVIAQVYGDFAYFSAAPAVSRSYGSAESHLSGMACGGGSVATGRGTCCSTTSGTLTLQAAIRVALSTLGLTPPFRAEAR